MNEKTQVIAAVIQKSGKFLLGKRSHIKLTGSGYWCAISGRIEPGETQEQAIAREVSEEIGLIVKALQKVGEIDTHDHKARIHWWLVEILSGEATLKNDEHSELRWVTLEEMKKLQPIFSEDIAIFEVVAANLSDHSKA